MLLSQEKLTQDLIVAQKTKDKLSLDLLQQQVNPHFLYNTLDNIGVNWRNWMKRALLIRLVSNLSEFYRHSLSGGNLIVSIAEELELTQAYVNIMQIRYVDKFSFSMDCPGEIRARRCLKLLLQPIIENSIYHGVKELDGFGHITVRVLMCHSDIKFVIEDNGPRYTGRSFESSKYFRERAFWYPKHTKNGFRCIMVITMDLPCRTGNRAVLERLSLYRERKGQNMSYKIIVADDEFYIRKKLLKIIDYSGLRLELAGDYENGQGVLDYLSGHHADIVLLDIRMPKVSGLEAARYIHENHPETKVIILSGFSDFEYAQMTLRYQVFDYLLKPVEADTLNTTLENCIRRNRRTQTGAKTVWTAFPTTKKNIRLNAILRGKDTFHSMQSLYHEFAGIRYSAFYAFYVDADSAPAAGELISALRAEEIECEYFIESDHIFYIQLFLEDDVPEPLCRYHCKRFFRAFTESHFYYFGELFCGRTQTGCLTGNRH